MVDLRDVRKNLVRVYCPMCDRIVLAKVPQVVKDELEKRANKILNQIEKMIKNNEDEDKINDKLKDVNNINIFLGYHRVSVDEIKAEYEKTNGGVL